MRRLIMAPALLAALALAGPAEARVEQKTVTESASSIESYWTADRMRSAIPAEQQFEGASARAENAALPWTSEEITTPYTQAPTSTHGKVFFTLGGNDYVCSGTSLLSGNKSVVWTAGHCVNEGPGAFATNWQFVPAYKDGSAPLGVYTAENLFAPSAWANSGDFSYDLGAAVVGPASGTALTDRVGGRGVAFNYSPFAELPVLRLSGGTAVQRRAAVALQLAAADQRQLGQPGDDGDRLRHDRRVERRRLDRRLERVLGQLLRLRQPAGRDVRPVPGQRRAVALQRRLGRVDRGAAGGRKARPPRSTAGPSCSSRARPCRASAPRAAGRSAP